MLSVLTLVQVRTLLSQMPGLRLPLSKPQTQMETRMVRPCQQSLTQHPPWWSRTMAVCAARPGTDETTLTCPANFCPLLDSSYAGYGLSFATGIAWRLVV
jgi:hypothetical protein